MQKCNKKEKMKKFEFWKKYMTPFQSHMPFFEFLHSLLRDAGNMSSSKMWARREIAVLNLINV